MKYFVKYNRSVEIISSHGVFHEPRFQTRFFKTDDIEKAWKDFENSCDEIVELLDVVPLPGSGEQ